MPQLDEIKPQSRELVMKLVEAAGVDVSDWENFRGGKAKAATNPKYCYEWSFVEPGKLVVLNLWFEQLRVEGGVVVHKHNLRKRGGGQARTPNEAIWKARALRMDEAIKTAHQQRLPVRVIVCSGTMRPAGDPNAKASQVRYRMLDPLPWAVTAYDPTSGQSVLTRGVDPQVPSYRLEDDELEGFEGASKQQFILHRQRERKFRRLKIEATRRANNGRLICEVPNCGFEFEECYGKLGAGYAQVHHRIPLSAAPTAGRKARLKDLAVVCANCHVMIHLGGACRSMDKLIPMK